MLDRLFERAVGLRVAALSEVHVSEQAVRPREPEFVTQLLQDGDHAPQRLQRLLGSMLRIRGLLQQERDDLDVRLEATVSVRSCAIDGVAQHRLGTGDLSRLHQRLPELRDQREPPRVIEREEVVAAPKKGGGRRHVAPRQGSATDRGERRAGAADQGARVIVGLAELHAVASRLLEVVGEDLFVLSDPVAGGPLEPAGETHVEVGPQLLGGLAVRPLLDEEVMEAERVLAERAGVVGGDQLAPNEALQDRTHARTQLIGDQIDDGCPREDLADHGAAVDHGSLLRSEPIQTSADEGIDRRWDRGERGLPRRPPGVRTLGFEHAVVPEHLEHLHDEQRVAASHIGDPSAERSAQIAALEELVDQHPDLLRCQRLQMKDRRVRQVGRPSGSFLQQIAPGEAEDEDRGVPARAQEILEEIEERGFGPLQVVQDHDERVFPGHLLQQPADRPERLLHPHRGVRETDRCCDPVEQQS